MYKDKTVIAIITAGGQGRRMGADKPKQFIEVDGATILEMSVRPFVESSLVDRLAITVPSEYVDETAALFRTAGTATGKTGKTVQVFAGGGERQDSVAIALQNIEPEDEDIILIHDGVRPYCTEEIIERVVCSAEETGACICGIPSTDTLRDISGGTIDREKVVRVQTPQGFKARLIVDAYEQAARDGFYGTDDAMLVERMGNKIAVVEGSSRNIKITTPEDLPQGSVDTRVGIGFDVHALLPDRKLILGGVEIPHDKGLEGHSDADVLTHALMDALLGAAALPDIGRLFPDTDEKYKGISSIILLSEVKRKLEENDFKIVNVDVTVMCQAPKLASYIEQMKAEIASALLIEPTRVGIKATTTERLGFVGREEGIAAEAIAMIRR